MLVARSQRTSEISPGIANPPRSVREASLPTDSISMRAAPVATYSVGWFGRPTRASPVAPAVNGMDAIACSVVASSSISPDGTAATARWRPPASRGSSPATPGRYRVASVEPVATSSRDTSSPAWTITLLAPVAQRCEMAAATCPTSVGLTVAFDEAIASRAVDGIARISPSIVPTKT